MRPFIKIVHHLFCFAVVLYFSHNGANGPESKMTRTFRPVRQVAAPGTKSAVTDCILFFCESINTNNHIYLPIACQNSVS